MAGDNPRWGYTRIQGALRNLGYEIGRNTTKRILIENGFDPAGRRRTTWNAFLRAHWEAIAATDFFTVEVVTWRGLVRYFVLFVIDLKTRRIEVAGISRSPDGRWMSQIARNLTDIESSSPQRTRYLIHDRDPLFTEQFGRILESSGVRPVRLPAGSPNLNGYAERFVRSIKSECLAQIIPLGERHLRRSVSEYIEHVVSRSAMVPSNAGSGWAGCFGTTGERRRGRLSFGTLRDQTRQARDYCGHCTSPGALFRDL
jgi:transposase InsO family protein